MKEIKKETYLIPEIEIIDIETEGIMAGSGLEDGDLENPNLPKQTFQKSEHRTSWNRGFGE